MRLKAPSRSTLPLPTQLSATPPARQRFSIPYVLASVARHAQHDLLGDLLHRGGKIHVPLRELGLRIARRAAEKLVELRRRHGEAGRVIEVALVEPEGAVVLEVDHVVEDEVGVLGLAIGREAHDLVLARIDLEAGVVGEGGVQQAEAVRPADLALCLERIASPIDTDVVAHSPTPSIVSTTASSNGEGKKAEAAWLS